MMAADPAARMRNQVLVEPRLEGDLDALVGLRFGDVIF